jgi:hypothetical protein
VVPYALANEHATVRVGLAEAHLKDPKATMLPWRPATPRNGESVRWECVDGRWIAIGLGSGQRAGLAFVHHSGVLCEYVDTYEAALALAKKWRTI